MCSNSEDVHFYIEHPIDQPTIVDDGVESSSSDSVQEIVQDVKGKGNVVQDVKGKGNVVQDVKGKGKEKGKGKVVNDVSSDLPFDLDSEDDDGVNMSAFRAAQSPIGDEGQGSGIPTTQVDPDSEDDTWVSEELGDSVCSNSEDELARSNKFPSFNTRSFGQVFIQLGMEFPSLGVFKQALKDYSMSIGRTFTELI